MFPRRYFAGRMFAPRYFSQSAGNAPAVTLAAFSQIMDVTHRNEIGDVRHRTEIGAVTHRNEITEV